jgi:hypothetical protein
MTSLCRELVCKYQQGRTCAELIHFLRDVGATARWAGEIHIVLDNLSAHKTQARSSLKPILRSGSTSHRPIPRGGTREIWFSDHHFTLRDLRCC